MLHFERHVEQTDAIQVYYGRGLRAKPPFAGRFSQFFKNVTTLTSFRSHFERFLRPLERTKLLKLRTYLKFLNCPTLSALIMCRSNSNHVLTFAYVSRCVARNSQWKRAVLGVWGRSPQLRDTIGGLGGKPQAAGGW